MFLLVRAAACGVDVWVWVDDAPLMCDLAVVIGVDPLHLRSTFGERQGNKPVDALEEQALTGVLSFMPAEHSS